MKLSLDLTSKEGFEEAIELLSHSIHVWTEDEISNLGRDEDTGWFYGLVRDDKDKCVSLGEIYPEFGWAEVSFGTDEEGEYPTNKNLAEAILDILTWNPKVYKRIHPNAKKFELDKRGFVPLED